MKITFVLPVVSMSGGIAVSAAHAEFLQSAGHDVHLVSQPPARPTGLRGQLRRVLRKGRMTNTVVPPALLRLATHHKVLDRQRPVTDSDLPDADIVIATWWETAEWVARLSPQKGLGVYFVQGYEVFPFLPVERVKETYRLPLRKIVVSRWLEQAIKCDAPGVDATVVPNGVDKTFFTVPSRGKCERPTVGFQMSAATDVKGIDLVVEVIERLRKVYPTLRILAFGSSVPSNPALMPKYLELYRLPAKGDIRRIYSECDVWLSPSRSEGFNLTALEAMCCGTPVVSTRTGWPAESIEHRLNGCLVEVDSADQFFSECRWVLDLPHLQWLALSENARASTEDLDFETTARRFESTLKSFVMAQVIDGVTISS